MLSIQLLSELQNTKTSELLWSIYGGMSLFNDMLKLSGAISCSNFDFDCVKSLLKIVIAKNPNSDIWDQVYNAVTESTPPPPEIAPTIKQTSWSHNSAVIVNSSEHHHYIDDVLKGELGTLFTGLPDFHKRYFGNVLGLEVVSENVWKKCKEGNQLLFNNG
jgi:hypothetical protein